MTIASKNGNTGPAFHTLLGDLLENILKHAGNPGACAAQVTTQIRELVGVRMVAVVSLEEEEEEGSGHTVQNVCPPRLEAEWSRPEIQRFVAAAAAWTAPRFVDPATDPEARDLAAAGIGPSFVVPLAAGADKVGLLVLLGLMDTKGAAVILEALTRVASVIALIIRNAFLYRNLEHTVAVKTSALALQARIAAIFATVPDDEMFNEVLKVVLEVMGSPFGIFGFIDAAGALVVPTMTRQVWEKCRIPEKSMVFPHETWGDSLWPRAIREKRAIVANEPSTIIPKGHVGISRHLPAPIILQEKVIGLLHVANKESNYTAADLRNLEAMARHIAPLLGARLERNRAMASLRESEEIFDRFMEHSPIYVFFKDEKMRSLRLSRNFETMLGKPMAELLGKSMDELFPSELAKSMVADDIRTMAGGRIVAVEEELDGRSYSTLKFPIVIGGKPRYLAGYTIDMTESRRLAHEKALLEDQLRQSQKVEAIGRLAGGVAHDFNNITAIILGYGEMLLGRLGSEDPSRKYAEQIMAAGQRSAGLTRQLLAFSRKQTLQPEVLDLNSLLRNLEQMFGRVIGEDVRLELQLATELGRVLADPGQIGQVVTNLVINARDAMPLGGRLTIETADVELDETYAQRHESVVPGRYVQLAVTDTGCGMDKATVAKLFEPFFTTKPRGKGTGLGLATVYGIVKQSGGHIWVYSEPGRGTSFKVYLPRTDEQPAGRSSESSAVATRGGGELILLVEDEAPLRELCETVLSQLGYRVSAAADGPEALRRVLELGLMPDLVLTDVIMPGMSGAEMVQLLRGARPDLQALYMSGYPDDAIARHGVLDSGIPFLQKPFTEHALATKLREALDKRATGETTAAAPPGRSVLMIDDDEQYRDLVQHFCAKGGYVFTGVDSAAAALTTLAARPVDLLLVDLNIPGTSGEHILRKIRAAGYPAPAIVLTGDLASANLEVLRPLGVRQALEKSSNPEPLLKAIRAAKIADSPKETGAL